MGVNLVPDMNKFSAPTSAHGQELLNALAGFIQNIIQSHLPLTASESTGQREEKVDQYIVPVESQSSEITQSPLLLDVLGKFIKATFSTPQELQSPHLDNGIAICQTGVLDSHAPSSSVALSVDVPPILSPPLVEHPFLEWVKDEIRWHVFNVMPIRLLSFDSNGSGLKLLERSQILQHIYDLASGVMGEIDWESPGSPWDTKRFLNDYAGYAILSHTWIRDIPGEVVYSNWTSRERNPRGFAKITNFCKVAAKNHGVTLGWMDTVCINKDSSSELDESIRSMYKWYQEAAVCVVYLSETQELAEMHQDSWFTRGWTFQELLAPRNIEFYSSKWVEMQYDEEALVGLSEEEIKGKIGLQISLGTKITREELQLCKEGGIGRIPISRRMELASGRNVTRAEDEAYSLMGILGVQISIAYGEGQERAFYRLVRELLSSQEDVLDVFNYGSNRPNKLIPSSVQEYNFRSSLFDKIGGEKASLLDQWQPLEPILFTHLGIRIPLLLVPGLIQEQHNPNFESHPITPYGHFSGVAVLKNWIVEECVYDLLDRRIYTDPDIANRPDNKAMHDQPLIVTFGILNFGADNVNILLPQHCLSVPLDCGVLKVGSIGPSDRIKRIQTGTPTVFELKSKHNVNMVTKDRLGRHGMQLVTLTL